MKTQIIQVGLFVVLVLCAAVALPLAEEASEKPPVGVYDSRSIAIAFVGSKVYQEGAGKEVAAKMKEHRKAVAAGDAERVAELKAWGEARQKRLHRQAFSTAPVDYLLACIEPAVEKIRVEAGVETIVSKWDKEGLAKHAGAVRVDLTKQLAEAFGPTEKQLKSALEVCKHDPVPLESLEGAED